MVGAQAEGAAPIVNGHPVPHPKTVASAIRIGNPASWEGATTARDESGGVIAAVTDTEILSAQIRLANSEGLFAEPASAAPLALLFRLVREGKIDFLEGFTYDEAWPPVIRDFRVTRVKQESALRTAEYVLCPRITSGGRRGGLL